MEQRYSAHVRVVTVVEVPLKATTFEEALKEAQSMKTPDLVKPKNGRYLADWNTPVVAAVNASGVWID